MRIKSNPKSVLVIVDPLSATSNIEVVSGNPVQYYNKELAEYVPDRKAVPLIVMPAVSVLDPTGKMTGSPTLTGVEWYEGAPKADGSNRIAADTNYEIGDGTVDGFPKYALKVKANTPIDAALEIYAVAIFTDTRTGKAVRVTNSVKLYSSYQDMLNYSLKIVNRPAGMVANPLDITPDADGKWPLDITAQLFTGKEETADANSAYWWKVKDTDGTWRDFTDEELSKMVISGHNTDGTWGKTITLDLRHVDSIELRVQGAFYQGTRPTAPTSEELSATMALKVEFPRSLDMSIGQTAGGKMAADLSTPVTFVATVFDNKNIYPEERYGQFFDITWKAVSAKPGSKELTLGTGFSVTFTPSKLGFDASYPIQVYAELETFIDDGSIPDDAITDTDGSVLVDTDGKYIVWGENTTITT